MCEYERYSCDRGFWELVWAIDNLPNEEARQVEIKVAQKNLDLGTPETKLVCDLLSMPQEDRQALIKSAPDEIDRELFRK